MELDNLVRAVELLGHRYTLQQLVYGHRSPRLTGQEPKLSHDAIATLLWELKADTETIEAFGEYSLSAAGQFQMYTHTFVATFVDAYAREYARTRDRKRSIAFAKEAAVNARALAEATNAGATPLSAAELEDLGEELRAAEPPPTAKPRALAHPKRKKAR